MRPSGELLSEPELLSKNQTDALFCSSLLISVFLRIIHRWPLIAIEEDRDGSRPAMGCDNCSNIAYTNITVNLRKTFLQNGFHLLRDRKAIRMTNPAFPAVTFSAFCMSFHFFCSTKNGVFLCSDVTVQS